MTAQRQCGACSLEYEATVVDMGCPRCDPTSTSSNPLIRPYARISYVAVADIPPAEVVETYHIGKPPGEDA